MKIRFNLSILDGYTTISSNEVELEAGEFKHPSDIKQALESVHSLATAKDMFDFTDEVALDMFIAMREAQIKKIAEAEVKASANEQKPDWKVRSERDEALMAAKQMRCQLDGVIKMNNPDYVPIQDQDEPSNL